MSIEKGDTLHQELHQKKARKRKRNVNPYRLFQRRGSDVWYFYHIEGERRIARSTRQTDWDHAEAAAEVFLNPPSAPPVDNTPTMDEFCKDFFVWGKCKWIAAQKRGKVRRRISEGAALGRRIHLTKWILPEFGKRKINTIMFLASVSFHSLPRAFATPRQKLMPGVVARHTA
jgi:hypothetical protein